MKSTALVSRLALVCALTAVGCSAVAAPVTAVTPMTRTPTAAPPSVEAAAVAEADHPGCGAACAAPASPATATTSQAVPTSGEGRDFGAPFDESVDVVPLATLMADVERYAGRDITTRGTIVTVCQRMGCWMEMSDEGSVPVRVPMAGHAFFLPRDVAGRPARVQGRVRVVELSAATREHLAGEGAQALSSTLAIEASSVRVD